ncbi:hypothetical protein [Frankia sp. CiP3]|nr:hypothetical protein [Frankia sp. CiP3]
MTVKPEKRSGTRLLGEFQRPGEKEVAGRTPFPSVPGVRTR